MHKPNLVPASGNENQIPTNYTPLYIWKQTKLDKNFCVQNADC
jgi:hypothetical protein